MEERLRQLESQLEEKNQELGRVGACVFVHVHSPCSLEPLDVCVCVQRCLPQLNTFTLGSVLPRTHTYRYIHKHTGQIQ